MSVTTKTGDQGQTSLFTGERIAKDDLRVEVYGIVDSLGSTLGMARAFAENKRVKEDILAAQKQLGMLMADFASRNKPPRITDEMIAGIEAEIASIEESLPALKEFIIPGDRKSSAMLDLARTTARTAERHAWTLARRGSVAEVDLRYLNRLSDYIFVLMRLEDADKPGL
ncbi:MAG: cob(I)yrinic acid a,c-diamide adenosyltransferase [Centipeda sp. (in: firmicutes)]|uniref:cob(I)yrinic acid a,c-diamide adenosyltransferase n=1 Tax=Selenomonas sp. oral taxon 920 TaxID=1884263 RepID=UPI000840961D|nr:cob(I)yrinic acid a,c-diamide adenosyltransferase [Selenomonas sp. oral taxon 920]AOH48600.1 ATP:cob(I)alamin adenosyltransferase [Selenomonas sp. oral taxon 920]